MKFGKILKGNKNTCQIYILEYYNPLAAVNTNIYIVIVL